MGILSRFRKHPTISSYDKIGGYEAIEVVVEDFYVRVLSDDELSGFFTGANMSRLKGRQVEFSARRPRRAGAVHRRADEASASGSWHHHAPLRVGGRTSG